MAVATSDPSPAPLGTARGSIAITREGDPSRPAVLCVHGIPGSGRDFRYLAPGLAERFFVVRLDMPGFGASPISGDASVAGWAAAVKAVADALGLDRFVVVSHSFGASAALCLAQRCTRVRGLALLAGPGGRVHRAFGGHATAFRIAAELSGLPLVRGPMVAFVRSRFARLGLECPNDWRLVRNMLRVVSSLRFELLATWASELSCPVIFAHAEDDHVVQIEIAREQAARFRDAQTLFWPEGGHHIQKTHADEVAAAICRRFG